MAKMWQYLFERPISNCQPHQGIKYGKPEGSNQQISLHTRKSWREIVCQAWRVKSTNVSAHRNVVQNNLISSLGQTWRVQLTNISVYQQQSCAEKLYVIFPCHFSSYCFAMLFCEGKTFCLCMCQCNVSASTFLCTVYCTTFLCT